MSSNVSLQYTNSPGVERDWKMEFPPLPEPRCSIHVLQTYQNIFFWQLLAILYFIQHFATKLSQHPCTHWSNRNKVICAEFKSLLAHCRPKKPFHIHLMKTSFCGEVTIGIWLKHHVCNQHNYSEQSCVALAVHLKKKKSSNTTVFVFNLAQIGGGWC